MTQCIEFYARRTQIITNTYNRLNQRRIKIQNERHSVRRPERDLAETMRTKVQQTTSDKVNFCA